MIAELEKLDLYVGKQNNPMKVPLCNKSKDVIEPIMKPQWWLQMEPLAGPAFDVVKRRPDQNQRLSLLKIATYDGWSKLTIGACLGSYGGVIKYRRITSR